jgi:RND family efflux transporter MFP subunit
VGLLVVAAVPRKTRPAVELDGTVRAGQTVEVGSASEGRLASLLVDRGDFVHAGQLLAELDLEVERAAVAVAKARTERTAPLRAAEMELQRLEDKLATHRALFEEGILSSDDLHDTQVEKQEAELVVADQLEQLEIAAQELRHARAVVDRGRIRSPIAGAVVRRGHAPGEIVGLASPRPIVTIAQLDPLAIEVEVPASELRKIAVGAQAEVLLPGIDGSRAAVVRHVAPVVDSRSGTFTVELELPNPDRRVTAGLACRVRFLR